MVASNTRRSTLEKSEAIASKGRRNRNKAAKSSPTSIQNNRKEVGRIIEAIMRPPEEEREEVEEEEPPA